MEIKGTHAVLVIALALLVGIFWGILIMSYYQESCPDVRCVKQKCPDCNCQEQKQLNQEDIVLECIEIVNNADTLMGLGK